MQETFIGSVKMEFRKLRHKYRNHKDYGQYEKPGFFEGEAGQRFEPTFDFFLISGIHISFL